MKFKCPCCGYYTFDKRPVGNHNICPVCFWEDEPNSTESPFEAFPCNRVSLSVAQMNFKTYGACKEELLPFVRRPRQDEFEGIDD